MKTFKIITNMFLIFLLILPLNVIAQKKEIPITTSSKEALKLFLDGREKSENFETAAASMLFDKAIQLDTNFAMAYLHRSWSGGGYNVWQKNHDKAISLMDKVSEGEKLSILYAQASAKGDGQKTKEYLDELLRLFPLDKRVQLSAAGYFYGITDYTTALSHYRRSTELDKKFAPAFNMLGYCYSAMNNYTEAEKAFKNYIKLTAKTPNGYDSYGELLLKMGRYEESMVQYKKALDLNPSFSYSLVGMGNNYIFKGDYESARKYYQLLYDKASMINEKFDAIYWKAVSYVHEGNSEKALETLNEYRALGKNENLTPRIIGSYQSQGFIHVETGNPSEGLKCIETASDLIQESNLSEATKANYNLNSMGMHIYALTANGELDNAKQEYEKCMQVVEKRKNPGEVMGFNGLLAYYEIMKGDYDKAIDLFTKADREDPFNWYYNAVAFSKKGDNQSATKLYEKITNCNINSMELALVRKKAIGDLSNK